MKKESFDVMSKYHTIYTSAFQPFSSRGTFETLLNFWRNLDTKNSANLRILAEPCKELAEPVGSAEPRLKTLIYTVNATYINPTMYIIFSIFLILAGAG